jgi:hypothetical protein
VLRRVVPLAVALALVAGPAAAGTPAVTSSPTPAEVDRVPADARIQELSGMAASPAHPGVLWVHQDSGNPPVLYALGPDGRTLAAVRVTGTADLDWEAMAGFRDAAGRPMLAIGDVGDNRAARSGIEIVLLAEPALRDGEVAPARMLRLRYPNGPQDAETLLVDAAARRMYVVSKGLGSTVYRVPAAVWPGSLDTGTLAPVATVPLILVTDGVMAAGGHPLLRTYGELAVLPALTDDVRGGSLEPLATARLPAQPQGEAVTLADASTVLLGSEGRRVPVLRFGLPADLRRALAAPSAPASPGPTTSPAVAPSAGEPTSTAGRTVLLLAGAAVVAGLVVARLGRRRRTRAGG